MSLALHLDTERNIMSERLIAAEPFFYAVLRIGYGATLATHGLPKLLGTSHGSMADPMAGSTRLIETVLGLPFAPQIAFLIALLEGVGGPLLAAGVATRPLAIFFALQMVGICLALGPTYPWIDRGIEYPIILWLVAMAIAMRGSGMFALEPHLVRALVQSKKVRIYAPVRQLPSDPDVRTMLGERQYLVDSSPAAFGPDLSYFPSAMLSRSPSLFPIVDHPAHDPSRLRNRQEYAICRDFRDHSQASAPLTVTTELHEDVWTFVPQHSRVPPPAPQLSQHSRH